MIYNMANTADIGRLVKHVYDATGFDHDHTIEVDTVTGRIVRQYIDPTKDDMVVETIMAPAPLEVIFRDHEGCSCHIVNLMKQGCTCGEMEAEKAQL
jgi:hypothetical protein